MSNVETVQQIYAAFGRGDVPAIVEHFAEDIVWEYGVNSTDIPWLQPLHGRAETVRFFEALGAVELRRFEPKAFLEGGDLVVVVLDFEAVVRETGRVIVEEDEAHIWRFDANGKVRRFRHRADTHQHWLAYHGKGLS